jgi:Fuc2NAc and GlcNAc transferase
VIAIAWVLNLFNFMDGIDGIAASEAACVLFSAATLGICMGHVSFTDISPALLVGAACLGFLRWNWPPASIFMGDVGSGFLGYIIAVIALDSARSTSINIFAWLILGGTFLVDATVTLYRRTLRGERIFEPHRTHAYQWQTRRWGSHSRVTLANIVINILWLLPWAAAAVRLPSHGVWICAAALMPLGVLALFAGAGRAEQTSSQPS